MSTRSSRPIPLFVLFLLAAFLPSRPAFAQFAQEGAKLVGAGAVGAARQGVAVAVSADGDTAIVGGDRDNSSSGAAWVWTRNAGVWTQQGPKVVAADTPAFCAQGTAVALSADGNTAIVGCSTFSSVEGGAWVWTRSGGVWTQQGPRLVGSGAVGNAGQGNAVSLSGDGNTALVAGFIDNGGAGAVWVWTRNAGVWTQQGLKLVGSGAAGTPIPAQQGQSVSLSGDGNTAIVGAFADNNTKGAAWIWTRSGGVWTQQGQKLVGYTTDPFSGQGLSVSISGDGNTAIVGGYNDQTGVGAAWVWMRSFGPWTEQAKLVGSDAAGNANQGWSVSISAAGNVAVVGGPSDNSSAGAVWVWRRDDFVWVPFGPQLVGTGAAGSAQQGKSVALSGDGYTIVVGGPADGSEAGAAWVYSSTAPKMSFDKTSLAFSAVSNGSAFTTQTSAQTVRLTQAGAGTVHWDAVSTPPWLVVSPASGTGSATLTISTRFAPGLAASQTGSVNLTFFGAGNVPKPVSATLAVLTTSTASPFGSFDTPLDGTTGVTGSIAVTGWALDDVEVAGVRILRDPVAGEPAGSLVFIGNAMQVDGARPDVQGMFPLLPRASRAGWGYLMLTNFLPSLGDGTFRLTAIADDVDGHSTVLGTKTITCANSSSVMPFGAIDTPVQGGTVGGTIVNFGWVLSPAPRRSDPPAGGNAQVVIDGAFLSTVPSGWTSRSDLSALFPVALYPGIVNALGVAVLDSAPLANGVHTISWVVTDNLGSASGIGSRFFTVSNGSLMLDSESFRLKAEATGTNKAEATGTNKAEATGTNAAEATGTNAAAGIQSELTWLPPLGGSLVGRRGFDVHAAYRMFTAGRDGRIAVQSEELDRIELSLGETPGRRYAGYLRVGDRLAPLPIGSSLNATTGAFTWLPGVGFSGRYDLVFVQSAGGQPVGRQDVRVVLSPKASNRVGPQTIIDEPKPSSVASAFRRNDPILLAGWAADLDSTVDRGVDAVHVWAYPATGGAPIWIGAPTYGGARPDVTAIYGDRFLNTGYGMTVQGLAPGTYDLAVFAYSTVAGGFAPAKTVRVTVR
jgi:hypothetical protein